MRVQFSIWKRAIFHKVKEIKHLSGGVVLYAAQSNAQIDAEIVEKGRFRTKTNSDLAQAKQPREHAFCLGEDYANGGALKP